MIGRREDTIRILEKPKRCVLQQHDYERIRKVGNWREKQAEMQSDTLEDEDR
jgi:hypothetical protein